MEESGKGGEKGLRILHHPTGFLEELGFFFMYIACEKSHGYVTWVCHVGVAGGCGRWVW